MQRAVSVSGHGFSPWFVREDGLNQAWVADGGECVNGGPGDIMKSIYSGQAGIN
ncbi:MAG: hypothetical protein AMXMBFR20_33140 [Planctomycetia bacterium]|jgi:hypothetical protein